MPTIPIALAVMAIGASGAQAYQTTKNANDQKREQKKQLALQRRIDLISARRNSRIKAAQFAASSASSGTAGSVSEGVTIGMQTTLQTDLATADAQYALQAEQFNIAANTTKQNAFFDFGQTIMNSGASMYGAGVFDSPAPTTPAEPIGTYFLRP